MKSKFAVCIGRQYGSGGREVGQLVAEKLGVTCYDKLLIQEAAKRSGMDVREIQENDENLTEELPSFSGNCFADAADLSNLFYAPGEAAFEAEAGEIRAIADRESAVLIGRCASSILAGRENVLSVFLYAGEDSRIRRIAARNGLTEHAARERMERVNRMRKHYFNFHSLTDWGKPESYDLMLATDRLGLEGCAALIAQAVKEKREAVSRE